MSKKALALNLVLLLALWVMFSIAPANAATVVNLELALAVDVSGSIDAEEFALQQTGFVNAFNNLSLNFTNVQPFAAALIYWSGTGQQQTAVGWTLIDSAAAAANFATAIAGTTRPYSGASAVGEAIAYSATSILTNDFLGARKIIDISGDGSNNAGIEPNSPRDAAIAAGIQINGLVIGSYEFFLYYTGNVVGPIPPAFVMSAADFDSFGAVINAKIQREVIPLPPTVLLLGSALLGLVGFRRFRKS